MNKRKRVAMQKHRAKRIKMKERAKQVRSAGLAPEAGTRPTRRRTSGQ